MLNTKHFMKMPPNTNPRWNLGRPTLSLLFSYNACFLTSSPLCDGLMIRFRITVDPGWNPGTKKAHAETPRFRIKKSSRLVEQPRKETTIAFYSNTDYAFTPGPISPYNLKKMLQTKWCLFFRYSYYLILVESCNILK